MAKLNKKQVNQSIESLRFAINDSHGAVGNQELSYAKKRIQESASRLMHILECDMNAHAKKLIQEAESMVDKATKYVFNIQSRITA